MSSDSLFIEVRNLHRILLNEIIYLKSEDSGACCRMLIISLASLQATRVTRTNHSDVLATEFASPSSTCATARQTAPMAMTKTLGSAQRVSTGPERGEMEPGPPTNMGPPPHYENHTNV